MIQYVAYSRIGPLDLDVPGHLGAPGPDGRRHHGPEHVPGSGPVKGEPALGLVGGEVPVPLRAQIWGWVMPAVHRDFPDAPRLRSPARSTRACGWKRGRPRWRWAGRGELGPGSPGIQSLVDAKRSAATQTRCCSRVELRSR